MRRPSTLQSSNSVADAERVKTWLVRDWPTVGSLDDAISRGWFLTDDGNVNWKLLLSTAIEITQAMVYLHEENVIFGSLDAYRYCHPTSQLIAA